MYNTFLNFLTIFPARSSRLFFGSFWCERKGRHGLHPQPPGLCLPVSRAAGEHQVRPSLCVLACASACASFASETPRFAREPSTNTWFAQLFQLTNRLAGVLSFLAVTCCTLPPRSRSTLILVVTADVLILFCLDGRNH
jgi:hypothetical protein